MRRPFVLTLAVLPIFATLAIPVLANDDPSRASFRTAGQDEVEKPVDGVVGPNGPFIADRDPAVMPPRVYNRVLTLLDEEVFLTTAEGESVWESQPFNTSQFTKIGLRVSGETDRGSLTCSVGWRYTGDESFRGGPPMAMISAPVGLGDDPSLRTNRRPDGIQDLYIQNPYYYVLYPPLTDFAEVRGLEAAVRCALSEPRADYGGIPLVDPTDDDPSIIVDPPEPTGATASLTEVKVLLRRD